MPLLPSLRPSMFDPDEAGRVLDTMTRPTAPNPAPQTAGEVLDTMTGPAAARPRTQTVTTGSGTTAYDFDAGGRLVNPAGRAVGGGGPADRMTADEIGRVIDQMFKANRSRLGPDAAGSWELDPQNARLSAAYRADIARNAAEATNAQLQNLLGYRQAEIGRQTAADQQANQLSIEKLREQGQTDRQKFQYGPEAVKRARDLAVYKAMLENPEKAPLIFDLAQKYNAGTLGAKPGAAPQPPVNALQAPVALAQKAADESKRSLKMPIAIGPPPVAPPEGPGWWTRNVVQPVQGINIDPERWLLRQYGG